MGFGGAAAAMITSLKNNNRKKERTRYKGFGKSDNESKGLIKKKVSKEALQKIRSKIKAEHKKATIKIVVLTSIAIITVFTLIIIFLKSEATQLLFNP